MKKLGLVGGVSWVSTLDYYKFINEGINGRLGGLNYAECMIYSLNFADVQEKTWPNSLDLFRDACQRLRAAGADGIVLCANTAHLFASDLQRLVNLPIIHIAEATTKAVANKNIKKVALLGTQFTMESNLYSAYLQKAGIEVLIPPDINTREYIQATLRDELGRGIVNAKTKERYVEILGDLINTGAEGIILGCTELPMIIDQSHFTVPVFDTTRIHAEAAVGFALS